MCKILTLSNTALIKNQGKLVATAAALLSEYERDGFGYVAQGESGVFGERTLNPKPFKSSFGRPDFSAPFLTESSNRFGEKTKMTGAALFHGRTSTNDKTLINTHPIIKRDWSLIHNGVVTNHGPDYEMLTTNDTEHLLEYLSTEGVSGIEKHLTGYYAICALSPDGTLHILRDSTASLFVAKVDSIDSFVFATTESLINDLCKTMKWKPSVVKSFRDNTYITVRGLEILTCQDISPRGRTSYETKYSELSLGRSLSAESELSSFTPRLSPPPPRNLAEEYDRIESHGTFSTDEDYFLHEVNIYADDTYKFLTFNGDEMTFSQFSELSDSEKLDCQVYRPDGSEVSPYDYQNQNRTWVS